ncbi:DNA-binding transcriptional ArsR family regulator [Halorubrum alkaliphilum]|uniref:DNA-binding transcriptional ArsR family regulator n=1 Tax=Halorubrum alkaliphilum TaxID=261290 RepID=A0A8T4GBN9_9EURY|nr:ArsR family transcriptional regulator [Halorubrum alkaliphilum]MBP1921838.1 DNA-binding transcriptional ArsR family regulator [Halorubrum alkaliphilum]
MRPLVSWMTKSDPAILELLEESDLEIPPAVISHNIDGVSHPTVKRRLPVLDDHGLVAKAPEKRGYYHITDRGRAYLAGDLNADDLE